MRLAIFLLGTIVGSFLNVVIYRLPRGQSIVSPPSFCPTCKKPIRYYYNIPIVSYVLLKGRCRECKSKISIRYPIVELLSGLIFYLLYSAKGLGLEFIASIIFVSLIIAISFIDMDFKIIPDVLSIGGLFTGLFLAYFRNPYFHFKDGLLGALLGGGILFLIGFIYELLTKREGMGIGDVKLLAMIGSFLGMRGAIFSLIAGAFFGTVVGIVLILKKGKDLKYAIPFGPFLSLGSLLFVFYGDNIIWWIVRTVFTR